MNRSAYNPSSSQHLPSAVPETAGPTTASAATEIPTTMQAIVYDRYGDAGVLHPAEVRVPQVDHDHVLIEVHAAGVNPVDARLRQGEAKFLLLGGFPRVPGYDVAGVVVVAPSQSGFQAGDRVMAFLDEKWGGGYAPYARCLPKVMAKIPDSMSFEDAAAIPLAATTALQSLRDHGKLCPGNRVLINGASGGVGIFAVQIAKAYQADVTGVASGKNESLVRSLGANQFIDYSKTDFTKMGRTWDLIFDASGKSGYLKAKEVLTPQGHFVSTEPSVSGAVMSILTKLTSKQGTIMLARPSGDDLRELIRLYEAGQLKVVLDRVFSLQDAANSHRRIEEGVDHGKIVLRVRE